MLWELAVTVFAANRFERLPRPPEVGHYDAGSTLDNDSKKPSTSSSLEQSGGTN
jgi:hypothetical protein